MKKKILSVAALLTLGLMVSVGVNLHQNAALSDVALANIEALASGEGGDIEVTITCDSEEGRCWKEVRDNSDRPTGECEWSGYQNDTCYKRRL